MRLSNAIDDVKWIILEAMVRRSRNRDVRRWGKNAAI
jgi:hypothetical protein